MLKFKGIHQYSQVIILESDEEIKSTNNKVLTKLVDDGLLYVRETTHPEIFSYGLVQLEDGIYHKAGYVWSSRVGVLNIMFDEEFVEVNIGHCAGYCMRKSDVEKLLPENIELTKKIMFEDDEVYFYPIEKK